MGAPKPSTCKNSVQAGNNANPHHYFVRYFFRVVVITKITLSVDRI